MRARAAEVLGGLFWSAAPEQENEFTPEDPLAFDYLHQQVGYWLFPGFSTRTARANYYALVLYGLMAAEQALLADGEQPTDRNIEERFERFERLWAICVVAYYGGQPERGESMRGVRGAQRAYAHADPSALPLDYTLISRQLELAALGAYLTSCRDHRLVEEAGLRVTALGRDVGGLFFASPEENKFHAQYDAFVQSALDLKKVTLPQKVGPLTPQKVGEMGRLARIHERKALQDLLYRILFQDSPHATTRALQSIIQDAWGQGERTGRAVLEGIVSGAYEADEHLRETARVACRFSEASGALRDRFDALYRLACGRGYWVDLDALLPDWTSEAELSKVRGAAKALLEAPHTQRFASLPVHGTAFRQLLARVVDADARTLAVELLRFHERVQKDRRRGAGWMRLVGEKVRVDLATYSAPEWDWEGWQEGFKFPQIRSLLFDLGRLE